jgi:hypothetical protein
MACQLLTRTGVHTKYFNDMWNKSAPGKISLGPGLMNGSAFLDPLVGAPLSDAILALAVSFALSAF